MHAAMGLMTASYCSLKVEVVSRMEHCSLIRFRERTFIVDTADLNRRPRIPAVAQGFLKRFRSHLLSATLC